ncbi:MAG TPA: hypothetical protein VIE67_12340, partial [Rudaea sp.]
WPARENAVSPPTVAPMSALARAAPELAHIAASARGCNSRQIIGEENRSDVRLAPIDHVQGFLHKPESVG